MYRQRVLNWFPVLGGLAIALVFIAAKRVLGVTQLATWGPLAPVIASGRSDELTEFALALAVGLLLLWVQRDARQRIEAADRDRRAAEALLRENAAVVRVCHTVAREFAQPLTGLVAYTEMLLLDCADGPEPQRRDLEGLREGVLRLQRLLECLRDAVRDAPRHADGRRIADDVERAVAPRQLRR